MNTIQQHASFAGLIEFKRLLAVAAVIASSVAIGCATPARNMASLECASAIHANPAQALATLETKASASPTSDGFLCISYANIALKKYPAAIDAASKAIALNKNDALAWRMRAFARYRLGAFPLAIEDAKESNKLQISGESYEIMGKCKLRLGDASSAQEDFRQWANLDHSIEGRCWMGSAQWSAGDTAGALKTWEMAEVIAPKDPEPLVWKSGFLFQAGDHAGALAAAQKAVALAPDSPQTLGTLARVQSWMGDSTGAQATVAKLAQTNAAAAEKLGKELSSGKPMQPKGAIAPGT